MVFMLSATNKGFDTCPIGFNAGGLITALRLPERYIPVMLLALGRNTRCGGAATKSRPDFARLRRGQPILYFTPRPGAPKRSDGGLVLVVVLVLE